MCLVLLQPYTHNYKPVLKVLHIPARIKMGMCIWPATLVVGHIQTQ